MRVKSRRHTIQKDWVTAFFHDPFGPSTNPEAWTLEVFQQIRTWMTPSGILATYGAAGHARRAMVVLFLDSIYKRLRT